MKKRALSLILVMAMVLCMAPAVAYAAEEEGTEQSADAEAPADAEAVSSEEESSQAEKQQEEPAEVIDAETQMNEEENTAEVEAVVSVPETLGNDPETWTALWSGYQVTISGLTGEDKVSVWINNDELPGQFGNETIDLQQQIEKVFEEMDMAVVTISNDDHRAAKVFYDIKIQINLNKASDKDTTFEYELDSAYGFQAENINQVHIELEDLSVFENIKNKLVVAAGELSGNGSFTIAIGEDDLGESDTECPSFFFVKQSGTDGNYKLDDSIEGAVYSPLYDIIKDMTSEILTGESLAFETTTSLRYFNLDSWESPEAFISDVNEVTAAFYNAEDAEAEEAAAAEFKAIYEKAGVWEKEQETAVFDNTKKTASDATPNTADYSFLWMLLLAVSAAATIISRRKVR